MKKRNPLDDDLFDEQMLYVIDGELMNKTIKVLQITGTMDTPPKDFHGLYKFLVKALKQISNNPTGEIRGQINDIDFDKFLFDLGLFRKKMGRRRLMHFQKAIELLTEIIVGKEESISLLELKRRSVEKRSGEDRRKKKPRKRKNEKRKTQRRK